MTALPPQMPPEPPGGKAGFLTKVFASKATTVFVAGWTAVALVTAATWGVVTLTKPDAPNYHYVPDPITVENATPDQFWSVLFTDEQRTAYANKLLHDKSNDPTYPGMDIEHAAYARLQAKLVAQGRPTLYELVSPSVTNTPNEIVVQQNAINAAARYIADSNMGEKLLAGEITINNANLSLLRDEVRNVHRQSDQARYDTNFSISFVPMDAAHQVGMATPVATHGYIGSIGTRPGVPTRIVLIYDSQQRDDRTTEDRDEFREGLWVTDELIKPTSNHWIEPRELVTTPVQ